MKAVWILVLLALIAGVAVPVQFAANARMGGAAGGPVMAAISFFVGTAALLLAVAGTCSRDTASRRWCRVPRRCRGGRGPGLLGGVLRDHVHNPDLTPRLGASATIGFIIGGQMIASIVLHHIGLLNLPTSPATLPKLGGAVLVVIGAIIVLSYREG